MRILLRPGNLLLIAIVLLPVAAAVWLAGAQPWSGAGPLLNLLGRLAGVMGMAMLAVAAIVSIRIPGLDQPFGGLTELWKVHHWLGAGAFLLLMAHPLLLAFSSATVSPEAAAATLWPSPGAIAVWLGWLALLAMMVYLAPTFSFFSAPRYQRWKALHALSAAAVVLAFAHTLMLGRSLPAWVWWAFAGVTASALVYRLVWRKLNPGQRYRITAVTPLADRVVELSLTPEDGAVMAYEAGQFVYLAPLDESLTAGRREEHPYTIASAPPEPVLRIAIKDLGDASGALQRVRPDTLALVDGPYGRFFEPRAGLAELWIGGGIGITPFIGRARALALAAAPVDIHLVYCANDPGRAYYMDELARIADAVPGFRVWPHHFRDEGPLNASWVHARCEDAADRAVYACGPAPMLAVTEDIVARLGVPASRYHSEEFDFL
jgi:predicted ferric reductase